MYMSVAERVSRRALLPIVLPGKAARNTPTFLLSKSAPGVCAIFILLFICSSGDFFDSSEEGGRSASYLYFAGVQQHRVHEKIF